MFFCPFEIRLPNLEGGEKGTKNKALNKTTQQAKQTHTLTLTHQIRVHLVEVDVVQAARQHLALQAYVRITPGEEAGEEKEKGEGERTQSEESKEEAGGREGGGD
jgi:hypothetical protein